MTGKGEYAQAGVDYTKIEPFKQAMIETASKTVRFPNKREVYLDESVLHSHGPIFEYRGPHPHKWCNTLEGLGNKNWIAEWMRQFAGTGLTYYEGIAIDNALMAVNDVIAQGAMPVVYSDEVAAGDSEWFEDKARAQDFGRGLFRVCEEVGMALGGGESPSLKYLIKAAAPVNSAPSLSGCVTGIIAPASRRITGEKLRVGDLIIGVTSSGLHANGISLVIKRALSLPDQFLTKVPGGMTLGEEALIPTRSYVALIEALLAAGVEIHALLPGTGDGVGKVSFDKRPFTYRIHDWPEVPPLFRFMREIGVSLDDCLKTFNWGIGYYLFIPPRELMQTIMIGEMNGYEVMEVGVVEEGNRMTIFEPERIKLPPPGSKESALLY